MKREIETLVTRQRFEKQLGIFLGIFALTFCATLLLAQAEQHTHAKNGASAAGDGSELAIFSTEQFLLSAPDGKQTGFDPVSTTVLQSIPDSAYATEGLAADDDSGEAEPLSYSLDINHPSQGTYHLRIHPPSKSAEFGVTINLFLQDGSSSPVVRLFGTVSPKSPADYEFKLDTAPGSKLAVNQLKKMHR